MADNGNDTELFWNAVQEYNAILAATADAGASTLYRVSMSKFVMMLHGIGMSAANGTALMQPYMNTLNRLGVNYTYAMEEYPNYLSEYIGTRDIYALGGGAAGAPPSVGALGGRILPRSLIEANSSALTNAIRQIATLGGIYQGFTFNVGVDVAQNVSDNSVLPAWREALVTVELAL